VEQHNRARLRYAISGSVPRATLAKKLSGKKALLAFSMCGLTVLCSFVLPVLGLLQLQWEQGITVDARYTAWLSNSIWLASVTALISVACALFLAYFARAS
jgi:iron(III) transport system permease protein